MTEPLERWSLEQFLAWEEGQPDRYELVDGQPHLRTGQTAAHSQIRINIIGILHSALAGKRCRPVDLRVLVPGTGNCRYPDVAVDCGSYDPTSHNATEPTVVFEVFLESDGLRDPQLRLEDYGTVSTIQHYVAVSGTEPFASVFYRNSVGNLTLLENMSEPSSAVRLEGLGIEIPLSELYDRVWSDETWHPMTEQRQDAGP